jgi:hypothetical protein
MADVLSSQVVEAFKTLERKNGKLAKKVSFCYHMISQFGNIVLGIAILSQTGI